MTDGQTSISPRKRSISEMQKLATIKPELKKQTQSCEGTSPALDVKKAEQIAHLVSQTYRAIPNKFGMDAGELDYQLKIFTQKLSGESLEDIRSAFTEWNDENSNFPHYSDILKIVQSHRRYQLPEHKCLPMPDRAKPTEEEKAAVSEMMKEIRANLAGASE